MRCSLLLSLSLSLFFAAGGVQLRGHSPHATLSLSPHATNSLSAHASSSGVSAQDKADAGVGARASAGAGAGAGGSSRGEIAAVNASMAARMGLTASGSGSAGVDASVLSGVEGHASAKVTAGASGGFEAGAGAQVGSGVFIFKGSAAAHGKVDASGTGSGQVSGGVRWEDGANVDAKGQFNAHAAGSAGATAAASGKAGDCDMTISVCGNATANARVQFVAVVNGDGEAKANFGLLGGSASASGKVSAAASASADMDGKIVITGLGTTGTATGEAKGYAAAEASASGKAVASLDLSKMKAQFGAMGNAEASAAVGAAASGDINIGDWLHAGGKIGVSYGASVGVGGGMILGMDECTFSTEGAAQGKAAVGVSFSGNIQVNPCKLVIESFDNVGNALGELVVSGRKEGEGCFWGPNCDGFTTSGSGMDCCENKCAQKVSGSNGIYGCKNGVLPFLQHLVATKELGQSCVLDIDCKGNEFLGKGIACCSGQCKEKIEDFAGNFWCPEVAIPAKKYSLGADCFLPLQCEGGTLLGQGNFCCGSSGTDKKTCQTKVKDWAGIYYCPNEAILPKKLGESCSSGLVCEGFTALGSGVSCCSGTCKDKVQDWAGMYYCPEVAQLKRNVGETCNIGPNCEGFTLLGSGTTCCSGTCKDKVKDWAGVYYCPEQAILAPPKKSIGDGCVLGVDCEGNTASGEGVDCCWFKCKQRVHGWAGWTC